MLHAAGVVVCSRELAGCIRTARLQVERALETGDRLRAFAGDAVKQTKGHMRQRKKIVKIHRYAGAEARGCNEGRILQALELAQECLGATCPGCRVAFVARQCLVEQCEGRFYAVHPIEALQVPPSLKIEFKGAGSRLATWADRAVRLRPQLQLQHLRSAPEEDCREGSGLLPFDVGVTRRQNQLRARVHQLRRHRQPLARPAQRAGERESGAKDPPRFARSRDPFSYDLIPGNSSSGSLELLQLAE